MDIAIRAQKYRGRVAKIDDDIDYIWDRVSARNGLFLYKINRDSRIFDLLKDRLDDASWQRLEMILDEIENAVPYQQIYIDKSQNSLDDTVDDSRKDEILASATLLIPTVRKMTGMDRAGAINCLFSSEPYCNYPTLKDILLQEDE